MTPQEIKDNAPDGATDYYINGCDINYIKKGLLFWLAYDSLNKIWYETHPALFTKLKPLN